VVSRTGATTVVVLSLAQELLVGFQELKQILTQVESAVLKTEITAVVVLNVTQVLLASSFKN
jgi:hypothetical protein